MKAITNERKPSIIPVFILVLVLIALFYALTKWLMVSTTSKATNEDAIRGEERVAILEKVQAAQKQRLDVYAWVDEKKGLVQIPIDRAMALTVAALNAKRPERPAYTVNPANAVSPAPMPMSSPAPQASPTAPAPSPKEKGSASVLPTIHVVPKFSFKLQRQWQDRMGLGQDAGVARSCQFLTISHSQA